MGAYRDFSVQKAVSPAAEAVNITNTNTTNDESRSIYIGVGDDYEFYVNGSWIRFENTADGSILPVRATGARHASDDTAPGTNDIVFLY
jgi:hypothetical protein